MAEVWKGKALEIGSTLQNASQAYPELAPLYTSWINFAHKHDLEMPKADQVAALRQIINLQNEEIKALEYRITTLLGDQS